MGEGLDTGSGGVVGKVKLGRSGNCSLTPFFCSHSRHPTFWYRTCLVSVPFGTHKFHHTFSLSFCSDFPI